MISYQLFTQTAVYSVVYFFSSLWTPLADLLTPNLHIVIFIHTFAWIFVLSSVIPSVIVGRERSVFLQFVLCLTIALVAVSIEEILTLAIGVNPISQMQNLFTWFQNPLVAGIYLSAPYLFMFYLDFRSRKKRQTSEEEIKAPEMEYSEQRLDTVLPIEATQTEQEADDTETKSEDSATDQIRQGKKTRRINFLHGTAILCFLLALLTYLFDITLSLSILTMPYKLIFPAVLMILAVFLLILGRQFAEVQRQEVMTISRYATDGEEKLEEREVGFEPSEVETVSARTEEQALERSETSSKELMEQSESLVEIQIVDLCGEVPPKIEKYDVRRPKDVIDSQC